MKARSLRLPRSERSASVGKPPATVPEQDAECGRDGIGDRELRQRVGRRHPSLLHPWIVRRVGVHGRATVIDGFGAQFVVPGFVAVDLAQPVLGAVLGQPRRGIGVPDVDRVPRHVSRRVWRWPPTGRLPLRSRTRRPPREEADPGTPGNASHYRRRTRPRRPRHQLQPGAGHRADRGRGWLHPESRHRRPSCRRGRHRQPRQAHHGAHSRRPRCSLRRTSMGDAAVEDEDAGNW